MKYFDEKQEQPVRRELQDTLSFEIEDNLEVGRRDP